MVLAQLAEQSLPTPKIRGPNPVIGNFIYNEQFKKKAKMKKKRPGMAKLKLRRHAYFDEKCIPITNNTSLHCTAHNIVTSLKENY